MSDIELVTVVLGLLMAIVVLTTVARQINVAYPILLVVGGLVLGFVPGIPTITLRPTLVFLLFLPPLLFREALTSSYRDLRAQLRAIASLSVGLVLVTVGVVAVIVHALIPGFPWAAAFVVGAVVAPTDEIAVAAIGERLPLARGIAAVLEGESLANDATSLVAYSVAVAAVVSGSFSLTMAAARFVVAAVGGVAVGLLAGWCIMQVRRRLYYPPAENTISLLSGFAAYLPADELGVSPVLAVVTTGLYLGRVGPRFVSARTRLQNSEMWDMLVYVLNGLLFVLLGLQLHSILSSLSHHSVPGLVGDAVLVTGAVMVIRLLWIFPAAYLPRMVSARLREREPAPRWQDVFIIGWAGMRGAVSLAAALALPVALRSGAPFAQRDLIIFLTFSVILGTLVVQGLSMPPLLQKLASLPDGTNAREEAKARLAAAHAALRRIDAIEESDGIPQDMLDKFRRQLSSKSSVYAGRYHGTQEDGEEARMDAHVRLQRELLRAEQQAVIDLRDRGVISDEIMRRVQHDLDLQTVQFDG